MKFNEKLTKLRKERKYSQEQLADLLGVSRQAVSKWESAISYPETEKLIEISKLFSVSIDELLKEEPEKTSKPPVLDPLKVEEYRKFHKHFALAMTTGVLLCIIAVMLTCVVDYYFKSDSIDIMVFFGFVSFALIAFIYYGIAAEKYASFKQEYQKLPVLEEEKDKFQKKFAIAITAGVIFCVLGVMAGGIIEEWFKNEAYTGLAFFGFVAIGVSLFVYFGIQRELYVPNLSEKENPKKVQREKQSEKASGVIMLIATAIYLTIGFIWNAWHPGWVVYPIAGILCGIVSIILED